MHKVTDGAKGVASLNEKNKLKKSIPEVEKIIPNETARPKVNSEKLDEIETSNFTDNFLHGKYAVHNDPTFRPLEISAQKIGKNIYI